MLKTMVWYDMIAVWHQVKVTAHWKGSHLAHRWFDSALPMNKVDKREKKSAYIHKPFSTASLSYNLCIWWWALSIEQLAFIHTLSFWVFGIVWLWAFMRITFSFLSFAFSQQESIASYHCNIPEKWDINSTPLHQFNQFPAHFRKNQKQKNKKKKVICFSLSFFSLIPNY